MFEAQVDVRVNTVNCVGVMGTGLALAFKNRYPEMFKEYQIACRDGRVRPGALHIWKSLTGDWIINFPTKRDWRDPSRYEDILAGLSELRRYLLEQGHVLVALPALGCGHGGLDWNKVSKMIENSLGDLDAHILVFEPADSRNAGRAAHHRPTDDEIDALKHIGFSYADEFQERGGDALPPFVLSKGDQALLTRRWVALLPSRNPPEREIAALGAISHEMALSRELRPVALVHSGRSTEDVAQLFLGQGVPVVVILPFGPLTRKSLAARLGCEQGGKVALLSAAAPSEVWSRSALAESMRLMRDRASGVLLSDPAPEWLNERSLHNWTERPFFYVRYDNSPEAVRGLLDKSGARPIGRRPDSGAPNLRPLSEVVSPPEQDATEIPPIRHASLTGGGEPEYQGLSRADTSAGNEIGGVQEIDSASRLIEDLENLIKARKRRPANVREELLLAYWSLIVDYHKGIPSLLAKGLCESAFALVQRVVDALVRSYVVLKASDEDTHKIIQGKYRINFKTIGRKIDKAYGFKGLVEDFLRRAQSAPHGFEPSEISHSVRRLEGLELVPCLSGAEIVEVLHTTTAAVLMAASVVSTHFNLQEEAEKVGQLLLERGINGIHASSDREDRTT